MTVADHQTDTDLEVLRVGLPGQLDHAACRGAVDGDGFFHEDVEALLDGVGEVDPAEGRWGREDDDVTRVETVHGFLVAVEADELMLLGDVELPGIAAAETLIGAGHAGFENVGQGNELDRAVLDRQGIRGGAGAAPAAADQGHLDRVAFPGVCQRHAGTDQGRAGGELARPTQKGTTRGR